MISQIIEDAIREGALAIIQELEANRKEIADRKAKGLSTSCLEHELKMKENYYRLYKECAFDTIFNLEDK